MRTSVKLTQLLSSFAPCGPLTGLYAVSENTAKKLVANQMWCDSGACDGLNVEDPIKWHWRLLAVVLTGDYPTAKVAKMSVCNLERFITRLVQVTCRSDKNLDVTNDSLVKPQWWPHNLEFGKPISLLRNEVGTFSMKWTAILRDVIARCSQFYKEKPQRMFLSGEHCFTRRVLAPKHSNINGPKRKKDSSGVGCMPLKKFRIDPKLYSTRRKRDSSDGKRELIIKVQDILKNNNNIIDSDDDSCLDSGSCYSENDGGVPVVKLVDVVKYKTNDPLPTEEEAKPLTKDDFMDYLHLNNVNNTQEKVKPPYNTRFHRLPSYVPFSSEVGQVYLKRENHSNPMDSQLRKLERLEWYLKEVPVVKDREFEVTFTQKITNFSTHVYTYPKRQFSQRHVKMEKLLGLCKPVSVTLENIMEGCKVVIPRNLNVLQVEDGLRYSFVDKSNG